MKIQVTRVEQSPAGGKIVYYNKDGVNTPFHVTNERGSRRMEQMRRASEGIKVQKARGVHDLSGRSDEDLIGAINSQLKDIDVKLSISKIDEVEIASAFISRHNQSKLADEFESKFLKK